MNLTEVGKAVSLEEVLDVFLLEGLLVVPLRFGENQLPPNLHLYKTSVKAPDEFLFNWKIFLLDL